MITNLNDIAISSKPQLFVSQKKSSLHHVIDKLITLTGPADVHIVSYSVSDAALRALCTMKTKGAIKSLSFIFDDSVKKHKLSLCVFASNFSKKVMFISTHIKLVCIENEKYKIAVITSANLTENLQSELYEIVGEPELASSCFKLYAALSSNAERFTYVN